ncbi:hypothetical protein, partial [Streptomyces sp. McG6]
MRESVEGGGAPADEPTSRGRQTQGQLRRDPLPRERGQDLRAGERMDPEYGQVPRQGRLVGVRGEDDRDVLPGPHRQPREGVARDPDQEVPPDHLSSSVTVEDEIQVSLALDLSSRRKDPYALL